MFFALLYSAHPVFSNELNNKISKYLQRKHFDIVLTEIRSLYFWIKVAVTKILMIDFYNLQKKKGKKYSRGLQSRNSTIYFLNYIRHKS